MAREVAMSEGAIVPREEGAELLARGSPGPIFGAIGRFASEAEESLVETIAMAEVLYVPVDDQGEPSRWAPEETGSVFKDIWRDQLSPQSKGSAMRDMRRRS